MKGRHILVTGASRGLGQTMAVAFAKAGASVIAIAARSNLDSVKAGIEQAAVAKGLHKPLVICLTVDVTDPASVKRAFEEAAPSLQNRLDVLVSNAGYMEDWLQIGDADVGDWWRSWEVNVKGQMLVWQAALPLLLASESGLKTIVNVSSIGAHMATPGGSAYQTTKLALLRLAEFLNAEYGAKGLVAYCVHPGAVKTDLAAKMPEDLQRKLVDSAELPADTIVYLTQEKRDWLRGRYLSCTWDMPELMSMREEIEQKELLKVRMTV